MRIERKRFNLFRKALPAYIGMKILRDPDLTWVNLDNPSSDDLAWLQKEFNLHSLVVKDLNLPMRHPKTDVFGNYIFVALQIPVQKANGAALKIEELDLVMSANWLITSHTSHVPFVSDFFAKCMASEAVRKEYFKAGPAAVMQGLIAGLFDSVNTEIDNIEAQIAVIEDEIFRGREKNMVIIISQTRRKIIDFMRTLEPMQNTFRELMTTGTSLLGHEAEPYLEYLKESHTRLINVLITQRETITALEQTNSSLLSSKTNETIRLLTVYATMLLVPTILPALFGMNLKDVPFSNTPHGFTIVSLITIIATIITFAFFKMKKWL